MTETIARPEMHWTTRVGVAGVIICALTIAGLNIGGWFATLPLITAIPIAAIALGLEATAFVLFEHAAKYLREQRWGHLFLATMGLIVAVAINIEGGHRGIVAVAQPLFEQAEEDRRHAQEILDGERAAIQAEISAAQGRVDAVPSPDCSTMGPAICRSRTEAWLAQTALDRGVIERSQARLDALPISVEAREPFPVWGPYVVTSMLAFLAVFGLTMFGVKVNGPSGDRKKRASVAAKAKPSTVEQFPTRRVAAVAAGVPFALVAGNAGQAAAEEPRLPLLIEPAIVGAEIAGEDQLIGRLKQVGVKRMSREELISLARETWDARENWTHYQTKDLLMPLSYALRETGMQRKEVAEALNLTERTMTRHWAEFEERMHAAV